jgi:hypothetical protein
MPAILNAKDAVLVLPVRTALAIADVNTVSANGGGCAGF